LQFQVYLVPVNDTDSRNLTGSGFNSVSISGLVVVNNSEVDGVA